jgi:hypothetical protein
MPQNLATIDRRQAIEHRRSKTGATQEAVMERCWREEPRLDDLLSDPMLDAMLARDRISRDELRRLVEEARLTLARVPREWAVPPC